ncbi:MAG: DUF29 domain-containing protein [Geminicoccaceae bacterium]|nr:DUF29 domain-containing protein [Geminicoccaceae bacterium]
MAKVVERPEADLYETDFPLWAKRQAELLRAGRYQDLDLDHLIEEVADLGVSERHAVFSAARRIIEHLLKLEHSPARDPRRGWEDSVTAHRTDLEEQLTATLRRDVERELGKVYSRARQDAARGLRRDRVALSDLPNRCPYALDEILDPDWLPTNRHGIEGNR